MKMNILRNIAIKTTFCVVVYGLLIINNLTNIADGIWDGSYWLGGDYELSLGRWAIRYADKLHFGISWNPLVTVVALILFVIGTEIFAEVFGLKKRILNYGVSFLFLSNMIICVCLSYPYSSVVYGLCFLFSMLTVLLIVKADGYKGIAMQGTLLAASALCLAIAMGLYQAWLGSVVLSLLGYALKNMLEKHNIKKLLMLLFQLLISGGVGAFLYVVILKFELWRYDVELSSYNGANGFSLHNIFGNIKYSIIRTYKTFYLYFSAKSFHHNMFENQLIMKAMFVMLGTFIFLAAVKLYKEEKILLIPYFIFLLVLPVACNVVMILVPESFFLAQQTGPLAMVLPTLIAVFSSNFDEMKKTVFTMGIRVACICLTSVYLWGNIFQVQIDQMAMYEGGKATKLIASSILDTLICEGYYNIGKRIAIVGDASKSLLFSVTETYNEANGYAKFGNWEFDSELDSRSWNGVYKYMLGINLPIIGGTEYEEILHLDEVADMPSFPNEGSIAIIHDTIVVKVSD